MNINRDYLIINDVKKSNIKLDNGSMFFYITDKNTQNIFVNLVINISNNDLIQKYANIENAEDYTLTMNIVKPSNTYKIIEGKLHDKEKAIFEFNLNEDCCDEIGTYRCELLTKCNINDHEEMTTSNKLTYKVKSSVLNDLDDIVEAPEYPLVIQLFDKLSDIEQYEEDRRANELARQLAEKQRKTKYNELVADMTNSIETIDNKVIDVENRISAKEDAVDTLIVDTKADINEYKAIKDREIDEYKTTKDTEINEAITAQDNKIDEAINTQNDRITVVENNDVAQNDRLDTLENKDTLHESRLDAIETKNAEQDGRLDIAENRLANIGNDITNTMQPIIDEHTSRLDAIEAIDVSQNTRLDAIEAKNQQQDDRLLDIEKVNKQQAVDIKCLYGASQTMDITEEGNSIYLQNGNNGFAVVDEIKGNTLVNCNKEPNKELILNGNINTSADNTVTITEGVDGGLVDVALKGNTMVNVCDQKDPVAITKSYTVETGNHVALQGEYDGKCRPVVTGNTLWIDNDTEGVLTVFDDTKDLRLQSSFEDKVVTQEMVDNGEELADNLGKYKVEYKVTGKNKINNDLFIEGVTLSSDDGTEKIGVNEYKATKEYIPVTPGANLRLSLNAGEFFNLNILCFYDNEYKFISSVIDSHTHNQIVVPQNAKYLRLRVATQTTDVQLEEGTEVTPYEPYKEYKKTFYLNSPLLEGDTIEQQGNNVVHVHRYKEVVLDGSERCTVHNDSNENYIRFRYYMPGLLRGDLNFIFSDKFKSIKWQELDEGINLFGGSDSFENYGYITILKSKLSTQNVAGFKQYLQSNPTTVVYQLATPQYEVISQNDTILCDSYINGHLDVDSVVPIEKVDFKNPIFELKYLYPSTEYTVQFESDNIGILSVLSLGGDSIYNLNVSKGINKFTITTPGNHNLMNFRGIGFNASNIVVTEATDQDFGYFEGMKSVGECEDLEVVSCNSDGTLSNTQTLTHEPLRAVEDIKDKYVLIDGKWYIERNCAEVVLDGSKYDVTYLTGNSQGSTGLFSVEVNDIMFVSNNCICDKLKVFTGNIWNYAERNDSECINTNHTDSNNRLIISILKSKLSSIDEAGFKTYLQSNPIVVVVQLQTPTYELIDYNPFTVYSDTTHISNNSTIPCNMTIKNTGFNCLLKPSTTYTVSSNLGLNVVTTPSTLTEDCLRFYDTDTSDVTTMNNVMVLEGDYTTGKPIPSHFSGLESAFEQEYDEAVGKYKVKIRVQNEDASKENYITFYINEPLRGVGDAKDRVYVKDDKVVVERNCGSVTLDGSEDENFIDYTDGIKTRAFGINDANINLKNTNLCLSNNFIGYGNSLGTANSMDRETIVIDSSLAPIVIYINKNKMISNDIAGFKRWLQQNPTTVVYKLAEPTYEEVEYNDVKLFIESFKNSTLFYNSNIPVTSKLYYSYSVPIVDTVAQTANVTDQQDSMIIDLATQCAVMEIMLM